CTPLLVPGRSIQCLVPLWYPLLFVQADPFFRSQNHHGSIYLNKFTARKAYAECTVHLGDAPDPAVCLDCEHVLCLIDDRTRYPLMQGVCGSRNQNVQAYQFVAEDILGRDHAFLLRFCSVNIRAMVRLSSRICPGFSVAPPALTLP